MGFYSHYEDYLSEPIDISYNIICECEFSRANYPFHLFIPLLRSLVFTSFQVLVGRMESCLS